MSNKKQNGKLHHVEIYVSDLKRSRVFWSWILGRLGYKLYQEWDCGFSYILDETYIVFVQTEQKFLEPQYNRKRTGLNHIAFKTESRKEIDILTDELKQKGINILYKDKHPFAGGDDYYAVFFEDPDRIKVEVVANCK
jgi:catechol 2,3-dioxygenase-like lactoylglutathione lyase family enzyme